MNISSIKDSIGTLGLSQVKNEVNNPKQDESFASMLKDAVGEVNQHQVEGYKAMEGIATGKVENLQEAVQKIEEAELSLKLGLEVKNKAIAAYKEISRMQA
ncbi:flagellar hook-basal body complex protein FliE [Malaciobacter halophilus]|uniref:Flagellar hook-basal body complex protein FliE n=1 Tax=Malaciobacter halophilus TaxID=197482 RepID=A0A2N1IZS4_9BACT|nr:flagellar hook-basal body complex protein FliE [Malaciobacter halophilus]AXH10477.1 flagellar proximal rod protein FliE [Malaciobacter halophilus]PKI79799.1 flagellar hook-basal body complex protein FliE [Malaciobacter halophilus]